MTRYLCYNELVGESLFESTELSAMFLLCVPSPEETNCFPQVAIFDALFDRTFEERIELDTRCERLARTFSKTIGDF